MAEENTSLFSPVTISAEGMNEAVKMSGELGLDPTMSIAKLIFDKVQVDAQEPNLLGSFGDFLAGTSPIYEDPRFKDSFSTLKLLNASKKADELIKIFGIDPEGNPIQEGTFLEGLQQELLPSGLSLSGAYTGAKIGYRLQAPIPATNPYAIVTKAAIPTATTLFGMLGGYAGGEYIDDQYIFGPDKPITPSSRAAYESGKTLGAVAPWMLMPYMISDDIAFGATTYLQNLALLNAGKPSDLALSAVEKLLVKDQLPVVKGMAGFEKMLSKQGQFNINNILQRIKNKTLGEKTESGDIFPFSQMLAQQAILETTAAGGSSVGAYYAEDLFPGQSGIRVSSELGGSFVPSILGASLVVKGAFAVTNLKAVVEDLKAGKINLKDRRQMSGVVRIKEILEAEGENVEEIIKQLASKEFDNLLAEEGKSLNISAGAKTGSPTLIALERTLAELSPGLGKEKLNKANIEADKALRNVVAALVRSGDPRAIQAAADMMEKTFSAAAQKRLTDQSLKVVQAFSRINEITQESGLDLSNKLYEVATNNLKFARDRERELYRAVPELNIDRAPEEYSFLRFFEDALPATKEAADEIRGKLNTITRFINRKKTAFGLDEETAEEVSRLRPPEGLLAEAQAFQRAQAASPEGQDVEPPTLTLTEAREMRSIALNLGRQLTAQQDLSSARVAFQFAEGLYEDMAIISKGESEALDVARAYSRSLNDVFTRSFSGKILQKNKLGEERTAPELLARQLLVGGNDASYLRIKQVQEIGNFALSGGGTGQALPEATETVSSLAEVTERIVRDAAVRGNAFDLETGQINPDKLKAYLEKNKDLIGLFPNLQKDLNNLEFANTVFNRILVKNKNREERLKHAVNYKNLMSPSSSNPRNKAGAEMPTFAVADALANGNRQRLKSLNRLLTPIKRAPEELQDSAYKGLKFAILEHGMTEGGLKDSQSFSPRAFYDYLFKKQPGTFDLSLDKWMVQNGVAKKTELSQMKKVLTELTRLEVLESQGNIGEIIETAGPMLDFYLRITGSALGTGAQRMIFGSTGPGSLIAAGAGSKAMRSLFNKIPESMKADVMTELLQNPELLARMMTRSTSDYEKGRLAKILEKQFMDLGFISTPAKRSVPLIIKEEPLEDALNLQNQEEEKIETSAVVPEQRVSPVQTPNPLLISQNLPQAQPAAASGPVDRTKYAALFPNDMASSMIKGGIGGLMG